MLEQYFQTVRYGSDHRNNARVISGSTSHPVQHLPDKSLVHPEQIEARSKQHYWDQPTRTSQKRRRGGGEEEEIIYLLPASVGGGEEEPLRLGLRSGSAAASRQGRAASAHLLQPANV
jgi:hypothetical protein